MTREEIIDLLVAEPFLLRKPLVVADGSALFGFDDAAYVELV